MEIVMINGVKGDIDKLNDNDKKLLDIILEKLKINPKLGLKLNGNLCDCYKLYFGKKSELRVVYSINNEVISIILAIGEREDKTVYKIAAERLGRK